jgi:hypothetical protein
VAPQRNVRRQAFTVATLLRQRLHVQQFLAHDPLDACARWARSSATRRTWAASTFENWAQAHPINGTCRRPERVPLGPGGQCDELSRLPVGELQEGELVQLVPKGDGVLPTLEGVTSTPWYQHTAVVLQNGSVVDPLLGASCSSVSAWRQAIVGEASGVLTMVNGAVVQ